MGLYSWNGIYISSAFFYDQHLGEDRCLPFGPVAFRVCAHYPFTQLYGHSRCHLPANCFVQFAQGLCSCGVCLVHRQQCKAPTDPGRNRCERGGRTGSVRKIATKRTFKERTVVAGTFSTKYLLLFVCLLNCFKLCYDPGPINKKNVNGVCKVKIFGSRFV